MKKILLATAFLLVYCLGSNAQEGNDHFFNDWTPEERTMSHDIFLPLPNTELGSYDNVNSTPLGSGLLILTALGGAYLVGRRKNKE